MKNNINTRLAKAWSAINRLLVIWKSNLSDKIKRKQRSCSYNYMDALHRCLTKCMEKRIDSNCTRILRAVLNKSRMQYPTKKQLYDHLPPISKTIQIRRTRHTGHFRRSKSDLISDVLLCIPSHRRVSVGRQAWTYLQQLCTDSGCCLEDHLNAMDDLDEWKGIVREIRARNTTR